MSTFTVLATEKIKDGQGTKGPFTVWKLGLSNGENSDAIIAEMFCPAGVQPPTVGAIVEGEIEKTDNPQWLDKFRPARKGGGGFRPEDPKRQAAIVRQHSQTAALTVLDLKQRLGVLTPVDLTPSKLQQLADFFDDDVRHGVLRSEKPR